jgi:hypothetical protein
MLLLSTHPSLLQNRCHLFPPFSSWYVAEHRGLYAMRDACRGERGTCLPCLRAPTYRWGHQGGAVRAHDCGACCPIGTTPARELERALPRSVGSDACRQKDAACGCQEFQSAGHCVHVVYVMLTQRISLSTHPRILFYVTHISQEQHHRKVGEHTCSAARRLPDRSACRGCSRTGRWP